MKFAAALLILGLAVAALAEDTPKADDVNSENPCAKVEGEKLIKHPQSGQGYFGAWKCMTSYKCKDNKVAEISHCVPWPVLPIRQYNAEEQKCDWFWKVNCTAEA